MKKKLKLVNKKAIEHNLAFNIKDALLKNDVQRLHKAAQDIIDAGYELEDMKLLPAIFNMVANALINSGFSPKISRVEE